MAPSLRPGIEVSELTPVPGGTSLPGPFDALLRWTPMIVALIPLAMVVNVLLLPVVDPNQDAEVVAVASDEVVVVTRVDGRTVTGTVDAEAAGRPEVGDTIAVDLNDGEIAGIGGELRPALFLAPLALLALLVGLTIRQNRRVYRPRREMEASASAGALSGAPIGVRLEVVWLAGDVPETRIAMVPDGDPTPAGYVAMPVDLTKTGLGGRFWCYGTIAPGSHVAFVPEAGGAPLLPCGPVALDLPRPAHPAQSLLRELVHPGPATVPPLPSSGAVPVGSIPQRSDPALAALVRRVDGRRAAAALVALAAMAILLLGVLIELPTVVVLAALAILTLTLLPPVRRAIDLVAIAPVVAHLESGGLASDVARYAALLLLVVVPRSRPGAAQPGA